MGIDGHADEERFEAIAGERGLLGVGARKEGIVAPARRTAQTHGGGPHRNLPFPVGIPRVQGPQYLLTGLEAALPANKHHQPKDDLAQPPHGNWDAGPATIGDGHGRTEEQRLWVQSWPTQKRQASRNERFTCRTSSFKRVQPRRSSPPVGFSRGDDPDPCHHPDRRHPRACSRGPRHRGLSVDRGFRCAPAGYRSRTCRDWP